MSDGKITLENLKSLYESVTKSEPPSEIIRMMTWEERERMKKAGFKLYDMDGKEV